MAYKVTDTEKAGTAYGPRTAYSTQSSRQFDGTKTLTSFDSKMKQFSAKELPSVPSERRKEVQQLSKDIKEYQQLKRSIYFQNRKMKFSNNRWRDGIAKIITYDKNNNQQMIRIRTDPFAIKNKKKNEALLLKSACKFCLWDLSILAVYPYWVRRKKTKSLSNQVDTFKRIQKVQSDPNKPLTLRDTSMFCFKNVE